ncbi:GNAT family N-acetyltransferase [Roseibium aestuarii]|uniref:GNAT family N-acetyltransferase n=1 Tax=Roseibium aestuarii TaxID=2600299 RepID=A0ABW4JR41_9HYPH|nr:GNAT family N-acetyltransferase [Roseibium aestuarii]
MPFTIVSADPAYAVEIARLSRRSVEELCAADHAGAGPGLDAWLNALATDRIERWITRPGVFLMAVDETTQVLGAVAATTMGEIALLHVLPEARFQGVSKALLRQLGRALDDLGASHLLVRSPETARRFFEARGFEPAGPAEEREGLRLHPLRKAL